MTDIQIECFLATCVTLNFTRSAEKLNYTPQAISKLIISLEDELGVRLFDRDYSGHSIALTQAGMYYMDLLTKDKNQKSRIMGDIYGRYRWLSGHFRLGISEWIHSTDNELADALMVFKRENPTLVFTATNDENESLRTKLLEGELDAVIISSQQAIRDKLLGYTPIAKENRKLVVSGMPEGEEIELDSACWGFPFLYRPTCDWGVGEFSRIMRKKLEKFGLQPEEIRMMPTVMSINTALMIMKCVTISDIRFGHTIRVPKISFIDLPAADDESYLYCVWSYRNENPKLIEFIRCMHRELVDYQANWEHLMPEYKI